MCSASPILRLRAHLLLMRAGNEFDDASKAAAAEAEKIVHTLDDPALLGRLAHRQAWEAVGEKRIDEAVSLYRRAHALLDEGGERDRAADKPLVGRPSGSCSRASSTKE